MKKKNNKKGVSKSKKTVGNTAKIKSGIIPLGDRVLIKPLTPEEMGNKSPSGIIIPETVDKEKPEKGKVIAVGEGRLEDGKRIPVAVKVGDRVVFSKYGYDELKVEGIEYYVVSENNILAIIK
jgi:chaperonin GroES